MFIRMEKKGERPFVSEPKTSKTYGSEIDYSEKSQDSYSKIDFNKK